MKKKKLIEIGITGVLFVILLFVLAGSLNKIAQKRPQADQKTKEQAPIETAGQELSKRQQEESDSLELKRDPFTAAFIAPVEKSPAELHLNGILWDKNRPMAIIDNAVVKIGDRISDKIVVDIKQNKVTLSDGTQNMELKLGEKVKPQEE